MESKRKGREIMKKVVFTFGRFNPPTIGHEKLINKLKSVAKGGAIRVFPSWTQNPKKDPLPHDVKVKWMRKLFPQHAKSIVISPHCKTAVHAMTKLMDFDHVVMVVGSDRVEDFQKLLNKYNGVESKHGFYDFEKIEVVSAGERDPDAQGVEGMSASKMRLSATNNDFESFKTGVPDTISDSEKKKLFDDVRKFMKISESYIIERPLTSKEESKKEEIVKALKREYPDWEINKKTRNKIYAIATAQAKKLREGHMLKTYDDIIEWLGRTTITEQSIQDLPTSLKNEARKLIRQAVNMGGIVYYWIEEKELGYAEDQADFDSWPSQEAVENGSVEIIYQKDA